MTLLVSIALILALVLLSAFFAGSETALTAASSAKMHSLEKQGSRGAARVNRIRAEKEKMIGSLLLGNTLVNIMASALATSVMIGLYGVAGVLYATVIITVVVLIFSEVLPKTYALQHADKMAMVISPVIAGYILIFSPLTLLITGLVRVLLKIGGADATNVHIGVDLDMLRGAIEMHRGPEEEVNEQRAMLRSILELADVEVGKVMTHRKQMVMVDAGQPIEKILQEVIESPFSRLPVWKDDPENIIGVIHVKSLLKELQGHSGNLTDISIASMATEPWFVPDTTSLSDQLQAFRQRREHIALVVDEYGTLMGMVTLEDIIEEIVGDIDDELDVAVAGVRRQPNGSYMIDGTVTIRDLKREFEWELPDEDYSTIAGLILHEAQRIPEPGQSFTFFGFRFDVVKRLRNQITLVRVTPPARSAEEERALATA
jgi:Mg2+/Co2+ transporter CorB